MRLEIKRPQGVNTDLSPYELPNEVWTEGTNISFGSFRTSKSKGYTQVFGALSVQPIFHMFWTDFAVPYWFYADENSIYRTDGTTHTNVTRESAPAVKDNYGATLSGGWTGDVFNGIAILNNAVDEPQYFDTTTTLMDDFPAWPVNTTAQVIRPFKNYLVAMDITKTGTRYPVLVKWSDSADAGAMPTSWDETDPTTDAGENVLPDQGGRIVDGLALNDSFMIYKQDSVWAMNFTGGQFIFTFRKVFGDIGALSKDCVVEYEGQHFVVGKNDVYIHNGVEKKSVIHNKYRKELFAQIDNAFADNVKAVADHKRKEIWVYFPSSGATTALADKALIWNWETGEWSERDGFTPFSHISTGPIDPQETSTWDSLSGTWDAGFSSAWGERSYNPSLDKLVIGDYTNSKFYTYGESKTYDGASFTGYAARTGLDFEDDHGYKFVSSITPHLIGTGTLNIYVGTEMYPDEGVVWSAPVTFEVGVDQKADFRETGRYIAIKFESLGATDDWSLTGYTVEYKNVGHR